MSRRHDSTRKSELESDLLQLLPLTLDEPAANLALDEALLEQAETDDGCPEVLRIWEPVHPLVVLGRSSPITREVNLDYCRNHQIPVLRRCSGGATIVTGPGCLMYAVRMNYHGREQLRMLDTVHSFVMNQMRAAIRQIGLDIQIQGTSDLVFQNRKFSGNSLRCKRNGFVYHGTIICDFDVSLVSRCLKTPQREPEYRRGRSHDDFLTQLPVDTLTLRHAIANQWNAKDHFLKWPATLTDQLTRDKYCQHDWNYKVV